MNEVVKLTQISKKYGRENALDTLNMSVHSGDIYGLVGQNGSGKTTAMKLILSLIRPTDGFIELFNETEPVAIRYARKRVGSIIETPAFYPYMSAYDNLTYYFKFKGITDKSKVTEVLKIVSLEHTGKKKFKNFSLGMKQRLGLALALLDSPDLLILDEPLNGLDPKGIADFRKVLLKINREWQVTVIISSHILEELSHVATTYGFIHDGKMIEEISAVKLEEKCDKFLRVVVDDIDQTVTLLEERLQADNFKVVGDDTIHIYDLIDTGNEVLSMLLKAGIDVKEVQHQGVSLENYFIQLIDKGGE